ncbi:uncharacterized protein G2W53_009622 [Senna tora]|uniref:Uncharacterized protein n=1 Tax=Senna tora TaxID=362788 RepID=A0A834WZC6_9FABA|nr:uncharacterized protein G2W53_009622 [Senna tora]
MPQTALGNRVKILGSLKNIGALNSHLGSSHGLKANRNPRKNEGGERTLQQRSGKNEPKKSTIDEKDGKSRTIF